MSKTRAPHRHSPPRAVPLTALLLVACGTNDPPPVFGGEGARFDAKQTPISEAPEEDLYTGPCAKPAPPSQAVLFEDFEDTNNQLFKAFEREGWWYVAVDETKGTVFPDVGDFKASALPEDEATTENRYALHGKASGFDDWGVVWGSTLKWTRDGVKCPFNGSHFEGLRFRARGSGSFQVKVGNPATVPGEYEGKCKQRCWDVHGQTFVLTPEWREYVLRWDRVQQGGWGAEAQFDPARILHVNFTVDGKSLPVEFWVDDIRFITRGEDTNAPAPALGTDASPGAPIPSAGPPSAAGSAGTAPTSPRAETATRPAIAPTATTTSPAPPAPHAPGSAGTATPPQSPPQ